MTAEPWGPFSQAHPGALVGLFHRRRLEAVLRFWTLPVPVPALPPAAYLCDLGLSVVLCCEKGWCADWVGHCARRGEVRTRPVPQAAFAGIIMNDEFLWLHVRVLGFDSH